MSVCHQLLSSCLNCLRASPQICQEPLIISSGPLLFNLRRDSLLQLWIFSRASLSVCHQLLSSCLYCPRASSLICQEPLFSSSGPLLFNLPRDSLLQLWIFSRASFVSLPSAFLQLLKLSQGLFSNMPGASPQQLRATSVYAAKRLSSAALDLRLLMINLFL